MRHHPARRARHRAWPALPALLLLAATPLLTAGAADDPTAADPTGEPSSRPSAQPSAPAVSTPTDDGDDDPLSGSCPELPPVTDERGRFEADVDGDGAADQVINHLAEGGAGSMQTRVELAAGYSVNADLDLGMDTYAKGAHDIDRDGADEIVASVVEAHLIDFVVLTLDGCDLRPVTLDGEPFTFVADKSLEDTAPFSTGYGGAECRDGEDGADLRTYVGTPDRAPVVDDEEGLPVIVDEAVFTVEVTDYLLTDGSLSTVDASSFTITPADEGFYSFTGVYCGTLRIGGDDHRRDGEGDPGEPGGDGAGPGDDGHQPVPVPSGGIQTGMGGLAASAGTGAGPAGLGVPAALGLGFAAAGLAAAGGLWLTRHGRGASEGG